MPSTFWSTSNPPDPALLLIAPGWIGDLVMAHSLVRHLQQQQPERFIDLLCLPGNEALIARMPSVRHALPWLPGHGCFAFQARRHAAQQLKGHYQQAILLPNSWKSALIPWLARIPQRTGYRGEWRYGLLNDCRQLDRQRLPMTVQRFVALGQAANALKPPAILPPQLHAELKAGCALATRHGLDPSAQPLALCPGAEFGPSKRWPTHHFVTLARRWPGEVWLFGSAREQADCAAIAQASGARDLSGRTTLAEAIDLLALASAVVSNDSGLMHIAAALGRPLVALYGSTDSGHTPPLGKNVIVLEQTDLVCRPCFRRHCPLGHHACLETLPPERVVEALAVLAA